MRFFMRMLLVICGLSFMASCLSFSKATVTKQGDKIEQTLRKLIMEQREVIQQDAPFVYERDVFAGGVNISDPCRLVIGSWVVDILDKEAIAKIQKAFGGPEQFEEEVVEVHFILQNESVSIDNWRAYRSWGEITPWESTLDDEKDEKR